MLAEARAYRLAVTMAHQNLAQLPPDLRQGISANARSQVIFSVSPEDAADLERHTAPVLTAHDLSHLDAYQAAARLVAGSAEQPAFTLRTRPLPPAGPGPGTPRPQGGPRRPQRRRRHRAAARPGRGRSPAAPPYLTAPLKKEDNPCLHCPPCPAAPAPPGGWPAARSWPPRSPPGSPPATAGCCACCTSTAS